MPNERVRVHHPSVVLHSPAFYLSVTNAVAPHPRLVFSIKHTALDFWRRIALNPTLGIGQHQQVVEAGLRDSFDNAAHGNRHATSSPHTLFKR